jgi:hypothetical protein
MREPLPPLLRLAPRNGAGVAALTIGAAALVLVATVLLFPIGGVLGIIAMLLGAVGIGRVARWRAFNRGQALAGLLLGAVSVLLAGVLAARLDGPLSERAGDLARLDRCLFTAGSGRAAAGCAAKFAREVSGAASSGEVGGHALERPDHQGVVVLADPLDHPPAHRRDALGDPPVRVDTR